MYLTNPLLTTCPVPLFTICTLMCYRSRYQPKDPLFDPFFRRNKRAKLWLPPLKMNLTCMVARTTSTPKQMRPYVESTLAFLVPTFTIVLQYETPKDPRNPITSVTTGHDPVAGEKRPREDDPQDEKQPTREPPKPAAQVQSQNQAINVVQTSTPNYGNNIPVAIQSNGLSGSGNQDALYVGDLQWVRSSSLVPSCRMDLVLNASFVPHPLCLSTPIFRSCDNSGPRTTISAKSR